MNRKEIEKLLSLAESKSADKTEFSGFSEPAEAESKFRLLRTVRANRNEQETGFSPFFTEQVMGKINVLFNKPDIQTYLSMQFSKVFAFGFSTVILILFALYFMHGQINFSAFTGTDSGNEINFISSVFYEF
ncbi:MAG: hypothetical protein H6540_08390 [Bacteroidales bacterium]|nr:hypothetical protein [Bacteroidales bacterium]MCP5515591.1 hypothetical protein [Spirochaetales bacterium]